MIDCKTPRSRYLDVYEISMMTDCKSGSKVRKALTVCDVKNVNKNI
jgi:hypothetical protein